MKKLTNKQFKKKANQIHGNKYCYPDNYKNSRTKIRIICPIHGEFWQTPASHLFGIGCPDCGYLYLSNLNKSTLEDFITKAILLHGYKFDYSEGTYTNNWTKIKIICLKHGEFYQTPSDHLTGYGCPKCKASKGETTIMRILEKHDIKYIHQYKLPHYNYEYDFYLPDCNLLIEFHGGQHFFPVDWFGGIDTFNYIRKNDVFKKALAREYKIPIIYFTYKHFRMSKDNFEKFVLSIIDKVLTRKIIL